MSGGSRKVALVAAVVAATLLPHPAVGDQRDELAETRRRLGQVEAVLGDARADAVAVAAALVALEAATDEVGRQEARLAEQVRGAYMTGRVTGLAVVVQATDLRDLVERAVTLSYVISADQDVLGRLEVARRRAAQLHGDMVRAERARAGPRPGCGARWPSWSGSGPCASRPRRGWTPGWPGWPGPRPPCAAARPSCGASSARRSWPGSGPQLPPWPAVAGPPPGGRAGAVTCRARRRPSAGSSCTSPAATRPPTTRPRRRSGSASCCWATASSTWARTTRPPTAAASCGRSGPMSRTATARPPGPRPSGRPTAGTEPAIRAGARPG